jgi:hypothetical protein
MGHKQDLLSFWPSLQLTRQVGTQLPCTPKKHGKRQADGGGQVSHGGNLRRIVWLIYA